MHISNSTSHDSSFSIQALQSNKTNHESAKIANKPTTKSHHTDKLKTSHNSNGSSAANGASRVTGHNRGAIDILA